MGEEGVVSYGPNSPQEIEGTLPETVRDEEQDLLRHGSLRWRAEVGRKYLGRL